MNTVSVGEEHLQLVPAFTFVNMTSSDLVKVASCWPALPAVTTTNVSSCYEQYDITMY